MIGVIWHHVIVADDNWPHCYGKPTDCYCEPEVMELDVLHRMVKHQDMSGKSLREVRYG